MDEEVNKVSMKIIIASGNAQENMKKAVAALLKDDFAAYAADMISARANIRLAHRSQTDMIQAQARGDVIQLNLLFVHAQDTLMTIMSEYNMIEMMKKFYDKMNGG